MSTTHVLTSAASFVVALDALVVTTAQQHQDQS
jgi:hypothetical protein